jgi:hypothetical protein
MDDIGRCFGDLRSRSNDVRLHAAKKLKDMVKLQQREVPSEEFNKVMADYNRWDKGLPAILGWFLSFSPPLPRLNPTERRSI